MIDYNSSSSADLEEFHNSSHGLHMFPSKMLTKGLVACGFHIASDGTTPDSLLTTSRWKKSSRRWTRVTSSCTLHSIWSIHIHHRSNCWPIDKPRNIWLNLATLFLVKYPIFPSFNTGWGSKDSGWFLWFIVDITSPPLKKATFQGAPYQNVRFLGTPL